MLPDIYLLQQFHAVMEKGNYTGAAKSIHISRQALTRNIQKMECMLGGELFVNTGRGLLPTELALTLENRARPLLLAWRNFEEEMKEDQSSQWLSLSLSRGVAMAMGANPCEAFLLTHPEVRLSMEETSCDEVLSRVESGEAEVGLLGSHPGYLSGFTCLCLKLTGLWLLLPDSHPLAAKTELEACDLEGVSICGTDRHNHLQRFFTEGYHRLGFRPTFSLLATYPEKAGQAPAFGIKTVYFGMPPGVAPVPEGWTLRHLCLPGEEAFGTYAICRNEHTLSPLAQRFWDFLASGACSANAMGPAGPDGSPKD